MSVELKEFLYTSVGYTARIFLNEEDDFSKVRYNLPIPIMESYDLELVGPAETGFMEFDIIEIV